MGFMNAIRAALFGSPQRPRLEGVAPAGCILPMEGLEGGGGWQAGGQQAARGPDNGGRQGLHGGNPQKRRCTAEDYRHAKREAARAVGEMKFHAARLRVQSDELNLIVQECIEEQARRNISLRE